MNKDLLQQDGVLAFLQRVVGCHVRALKRLHDGTPAESWDAARHSRPHYFHDLVMDEIKSEFTDDAEFTYVENRQLRTVLTPWFEMRIKKASRKLKSVSLNKTTRTEVWLQMTLGKELTPLDKIIVGYTVPRNWSLIERVALLEMRGRKVIDYIDIPMDIPEMFEEQTGGFIDADYRIRPDIIKRERQEEMDLREIDSQSTGTGE